MENFKLKIVQDDSPESPREWDNCAILLCWHGRYNLGDHEHGYRTKSALPTERAVREHFDANDDRALVIRPLYLYDHSGITIDTKPFSCQWDSGQIGWAVVTQKTAVKESGRKSLAGQKAWALRILEGEVKSYDQFLCGDVYGYQVLEVDEDGEEGDCVDSCYGFYGEEYAREEGEAALKSVQGDAAKESHERVYWEARDVQTVAA